jgi:hypothetical protein
MNTQRIAVFFLFGLLLLAGAGRAEDEKLLRLADAMGIKKIDRVTVVWFPQGCASREGGVAAVVDSRELLDALLARLAGFPAKGGAHKDFPSELSHWIVYIHGSNQKITAFDIYGFSLQSPLDATFSPSATDDLKNSELMKLLQRMVPSAK